MIVYFEVKNFENFQHYKDRNPPWIKLYNCLLEDYDFSRLQDASKMHLIAIWLLASRSDNKLPYDKEWIKSRINATEEVDLDLFLQLNFINKINDDSNMLAECKQDAIPEKRREEREKENTKKENLKVKEKKFSFIHPQEYSYLIEVGKKPFKPNGQGARLGDDWELCQEWGVWAVKEMGYDEERVLTEASKFKDYFTSPNCKKPVKKDWFQTWRNWIRR